MNDLERWAVEHGHMLVQQIVESSQIASETQDSGTRFSRARIAQEKLFELHELAQRFPSLRLEELEGIHGAAHALTVVEAVHQAPVETGMLNGRHYSDYVEEVKRLKRERRDQEAADLLLRLIEVIEQEAEIKGPSWTVAPWYYEHLSIVYRKLKRKDLSDQVAARYAALPGAVKR